MFVSSKFYLCLITLYLLADIGYAKSGKNVHEHNETVHEHNEKRKSDTSTLKDATTTTANPKKDGLELESTTVQSSITTVLSLSTDSTSTTDESTSAETKWHEIFNRITTTISPLMSINEQLIKQFNEIESNWGNVTTIDFFNSTLEMKNFDNEMLLNITVIPEDQLCVFCHLVMKQFKDKVASDSEQFKKDMTSSCCLLSDAKKTAKCIEKITDAKIKRISKTTVLGLCIQEKLCKQGQNVELDLERATPNVAPKKDIPEVKSTKKESLTTGAR